MAAGGAAAKRVPVFGISPNICHGGTGKTPTLRKPPQNSSCPPQYKLYPSAGAADSFSPFLFGIILRLLELENPARSCSPPPTPPVFLPVVLLVHTVGMHVVGGWVVQSYFYYCLSNIYNL